MNTTFWNCDGKGHKADECPSKRVSGSNKNKVRGECSAPRVSEPDMKLSMVRFSRTTRPLNARISNWKKLSCQVQQKYQVQLQTWPPI